MIQAILFATLAGAMIPLGGLLASHERIKPDWLETDLRHSVIAFGGGALLSAIAFVLVPRGIEALSPALALIALGAGGLAFAVLDWVIARQGGSKGQLVAMLADFIPEAVALGALFAAGGAGGPLLALLIALQNLPEGFNAFREQREGGQPARKVLAIFAAIACLGPVAAIIGHVFLAGQDAMLGGMMIFAAGGILYLIFQDIAPDAPVANTQGPPLGAVFGFMLGMAGHIFIG